MTQDPRALIQKAEKTIASASGGFSFFGGGKEQKYQDAVDYYIQAANAYRMQSAEREAGQAFEKAAQIQTNQLNELDDAANSMVDAFKVYKNVDPEAAVRCLEVAIQRYCARGNFRRAATNKEAAGELFETALGDLGRAVDAYETAAKWYDTDNAPAMANKLWLRVADIAAINEDYDKATDTYERVAKASVNNALMRYSVKEYFFKAGICHLATGDMVAVDRAMAQYAEMDPTFTAQREFKLLTDLTGAIKAGKADDFTAMLFSFDQVSKLDKWKTTIFLRIKNKIQASAGPTVSGTDDDDEFA